jgi:hypothetical protein
MAMDCCGGGWRQLSFRVVCIWRMAQLLLIPDARPLEQRLGASFFQEAPRQPGVYLMRDAGGKVVYVGKAKNLRQRLTNYRVANPDRMPKRHLRMVHEVQRIDFELCPNEPSAVARESRLLRSLKPKFNRAGVWPGKSRFLTWRIQEMHLELAVVETPEPGWQRFGPLGGNAAYLHRTLARLLWLALNPGRGLTDVPAGWIHGRFVNPATLNCGRAGSEISAALGALFWGQPEEFFGWLSAKLAERTSLFEQRMIQSELETMQEFSAQRAWKAASRQQLALL